MHNIGVFIPIVAIIATAWVIISIIRFRSRELPAADQEQSARHAAALAGENDRLKGQISRLEERLAVLERIATDPAERTAREIEQLR